jgi:hypothetical protein
MQVLRIERAGSCYIVESQAMVTSLSVRASCHEVEWEESGLGQLFWDPADWLGQ